MGFSKQGKCGRGKKWLRGSAERDRVKRGEKGKWKYETWATVTISPCNRRNERQERLRDTLAHINAVKRNKSRVAVELRLCHNPAIHSNLYDDDTELHR